jgi:hypothetical protein|nr:MAG TPA: KilA protein [Caudoviricetes sp.]
MKTNQIMIRPMGEFKVTQRTKDGFFCATELLAQWNEKSGMKKEVTKFFDLQSTSELIKVIMERENLNTQDSTYLKTRGKNGGTWMHPILFIDFAMWINPSFKYDVLKFVYDELIKFRNLAGDAYPRMCAAVYTILPKEVFKQKVSDLAKSLNIIVYGKHESEMRNKIGDEAKIREMYELEQQIAQWIELGFIKNYQELKQALTKVYYQRHPDVLPM